MGSQAELIVVGGDASVGGANGLVDQGRRLLEELESRWSRFLPESDISRINTRLGDTVAVHRSTCEAVAHAVAGWRLTEGRYDPTVFSAMVAHGYDRNFRNLHGVSDAQGTATTAPGCDGVDVDRVASTITITNGAGLDLGGIGKGYAADVVAAELMDAGAAGVLVNLGGDVRVRGESGEGAGWRIRLDDPRIDMFTDDPNDDVVHPHLCDVTLCDAAVAVSSSRTRHWRNSAGEAHHLVDPHTGLPSDGGLVGAIVIAGSGWWAEVLTKALLVSREDEAQDLLAKVGSGSQGLVTTADNKITYSPGFRSFISGFGSLASEHY
jgi:FAD:protein FMN transferase